jgi:O-antigen/teichoic acid export membrane protein
LYAGQIALALLHFGPMSFALPSAFVAVFECIAYGMAAGFLPNRKRLTISLFKDLFRASAWIMAGALATTLINNGDYLIIGRMQPKTLGTYFFGCQLSIGFAVIFAAGIRSVLMPTLAQFSDQPERFGNAYLRSLRTFTFVFIPLCVLAAIATPPFVHLCWRGKWDAATPVVVIMTFALAFRMVTPVALAGMEARGTWALQAVLLFIDGVGTILAAIIGCLIGGLFEIAICVAINRSVMALVQCAVVGREAGLKHRSILREVMPPIAIGAASAIASYLIYRAVGQSQDRWITAAVLGVLFVSLFLAGSRLITPRRMRESIQLLKHVPGLRGGA